MTPNFVAYVLHGKEDLMQNTLSRRGMALGTAVTTALVVGLPSLAFAQSTTVADANTAVTSAAADATSIVTAGIPVVLGVAAIWLALKMGKKLIRSV
jgi:hypothetical protein